MASSLRAHLNRKAHPESVCCWELLLQSAGAIEPAYCWIDVLALFELYAHNMEILLPLRTWISHVTER